jgi:hypothetical protein
MLLNDERARGSVLSGIWRFAVCFAKALGSGPIIDGGTLCQR